MRNLTSFSTLIGATGFAVWALAAGVHMEKRPVASDNGKTLTLTGTLVGLDGGDATVKVQANGIATVACVAPSESEASGGVRIRRIPVTLYGEQRIRAADGMGSATVFSVTTNELSFSAAREARCPGDDWTPEVRDVSFSIVTVRVLDGNRQVQVLRRTMTL